MTLLFLLFACPPTEKEDSKELIDDSSGNNNGTDSGEQNVAPSAPEIAVTPEIPLAGEALTVTILTESTDPNADPVSYSYAWSVDGAAQADLSGEIVPSGRTLDGEEWSVAVTATDGDASSAPVTASVHIGNQPPVAPTLHIDPAAPNAGDDLTLVFDTPAADPDGQTLTQTIRWTESDTIRNDLADETVIPGRQVHGGEVWIATVTVSDGVNPEVTAEASVTVTNTPPDLQSVEIRPATPADIDDLRCVVVASDDDGDTLTTSYRWFKDGAEQTAIGDDDTVDNTLTAPEEQWYCEATVADAAESETGQSAAVEIQGPTRLWWTRILDVTLNSDGVGGYDSLAGTQSFELVSEGTGYGVNDCLALWDVTGSPNICRNCTYDFTTTATFNAAASRFNTANCATLGVDGLGAVDYSTSNLGSSYITGPYMPITISYSGYISFYNVQVYQDFGQNYVDSGYGYGYGYAQRRTFITDQTIDSAGDLHLYANTFYYALRP